MPKRLCDVSPIMMDAFGSTLDGVMGENLRYVVVVFDPITGEIKTRSNANPDDLRKVFEKAAGIYNDGNKVCIQCDHILPIDYFDGGINPDKCYLCDEMPF